MVISSLATFLLLHRILEDCMKQKITDPEYSLPQIQALSGMRVLSTGTTEPMLIRGVDMNTGSRGQFVVKFTKGPRMSTTSACFETLGVWIGKELGLNVVEPVIIHIGQDFVSLPKIG
jgi:hypothetical protein